MSAVVVIPPDVELIRAVAKLTNALSRLAPEDPLRPDLEETIRGCIYPRLQIRDPE